MNKYYLTYLYNVTELLYQQKSIRRMRHVARANSIPIRFKKDTTGITTVHASMSFSNDTPQEYMDRVVPLLVKTYGWGD